jgi:phosphoserine phosphatase
MTTVIITRHGHVEGIDPPFFRGQSQLALTTQGRQEATLVAEHIASTWRPAAVRTSPLERCTMTGAKIAEACGLLPTIVEGLIDLNYGEWQGKTHEEVKKHWPQLYELWKTSPHLARFPSGESVQDIALRTADVFRGVVHDFPNESDTVILVGHDSVNRALLLQLLDQPLSAYWKIAQDPCCINVIKYEEGAIRALSINETQHTKSPNIRKKPGHPEVTLRPGPQVRA